MRRFLCIALSLAMLLSLCACGGDKNEKRPDESAVSSEISSQKPESSAPEGGGSGEDSGSMFPQDDADGINDQTVFDKDSIRITAVSLTSNGGKGRATLDFTVENGRSSAILLTFSNVLVNHYKMDTDIQDTAQIPAGGSGTASITLYQPLFAACNITTITDFIFDITCTEPAGSYSSQVLGATVKTTTADEPTTALNIKDVVYEDAFIRISYVSPLQVMGGAGVRILFFNKSASTLHGLYGTNKVNDNPANIGGTFSLPSGASLVKDLTLSAGTMKILGITELSTVDMRFKMVAEDDGGFWDATQADSVVISLVEPEVPEEPAPEVQP